MGFRQTHGAGEATVESLQRLQTTIAAHFRDPFRERQVRILLARIADVISLAALAEITGSRRETADADVRRQVAELVEGDDLDLGRAAEVRRKIDRALFAVWMNVLADVPGSVLWLLRDNDGAEKNLRREAQQRGIDPSRMRTISYGKERPVAVCNDISCWSQNRRAVTVLNAGA